MKRAYLCIHTIPTLHTHTQAHAPPYTYPRSLHTHHTDAPYTISALHTTFHKHHTRTLCTHANFNTHTRFIHTTHHIPYHAPYSLQRHHTRAPYTISALHRHHTHALHTHTPVSHTIPTLYARCVWSRCGVHRACATIHTIPTLHHHTTLDTHMVYGMKRGHGCVCLVGSAQMIWCVWSADSVYGASVWCAWSVV